MSTTNDSTRETQDAIRTFVEYRNRYLTGDEKGEAQVFCDRLFKAFGHEGFAEAGATLEFRIKKQNNRTSFADLMWKPRCLIEMKKEGTDLSRHFRQALDYWTRAVPDRPRYVVLCNFDEFHIYDFNKQVDQPIDIVSIGDLPDRYDAFGFLFPVPEMPVFRNDLEMVSRTAAAEMGGLFMALHKRGIDREQAQRFVLQCVVSMFSEDVGLLPRAVFSKILEDASNADEAYDLIYGLFTQMNTSTIPTAGRYKGVRYFNGGLFADIPALLLENSELRILKTACQMNWSGVRPEIFGTLFEGSMEEAARHAAGAHYTSQADIIRIVQPSIVAPWRTRIDDAKTVADMNAVLHDISTFRVLDPACGSGNFLYVAYREMRRLESDATAKLNSLRRSKGAEDQGEIQYVSTENFCGMDNNPFAVEVAKVTMMIATKLASDELHDSHDVLPLQSLDGVIVCADALFSRWPSADAIIGNPPYIGRRRIVEELGASYASRLPGVHPAVSGASDFVSYWFPLAHDHLREQGRAGFVATNSIRQNDSRVSSLDYIVDHGGTIFEAVDSQPWSGDANVHVSIVNWVKGDYTAPKLLWKNDGQLCLETEHISSSLRATVDVRTATALVANRRPKRMFQGQTPGHSEGFIISSQMASAFIDAGEGEVVHEWVGGGTDLISGRQLSYVIDIPIDDLSTAFAMYPECMGWLRRHVMPGRILRGEEQERENAEILSRNPGARPNNHHIALANRWWQLFYRRKEMLDAFAGIDHYFAIPRVTVPDRNIIVKRLPVSVRPGDLVSVVALEDVYSFGIISSSAHKAWLDERCSTLGKANRYTSTTVWDTFSWPQYVRRVDYRRVESAAEGVLFERDQLMRLGVTLEEMYNTIRHEGKSRLRDAHDLLDAAVLAAYQFDPHEDVVEQLLALNHTVQADQSIGVSPGPLVF